ncbi:MAG: glycosyltransferase family 4 protein [Pseudomonadota bacterium]
MKLLTFSTLFPNAQRPNHGIFVETRLRYLVASGNVESRVIAPIPWFPFTHPRFGDYASFAQVPKSDTRHGIEVVHPRYFLPPKVGMTAAPFLLAHAVKPVIGRMIDDGYDFDLIDAHYFYPDGVAAVLLGKYFNKPVVVTSRGSDINVLPHYYLPKKMIVWAARRAAGLITVCNALKTEMMLLGIDPTRITPLRNGVDLQRFQPIDRAAGRVALGLNQFTLLSVGHLEPHKGHDLAITALATLPDVSLLIAGRGPARPMLEALVQRLGLADRVTFLGAVPQIELRNYYGAADALVLASSREGWANVLLESMACGTPVIASNVSGTPEVVTSPDAGVLMRERSASGLAEALGALRANYPSHQDTRLYAEKFSWDATTEGQITLFENIIREHRQ